MTGSLHEPYINKHIPKLRFVGVCDYEIVTSFLNRLL